MRSCRALSFGALTLVLFSSALAAQDVNRASAPATSTDKILAGYFEEWSIYYANFNVANLERNGVAGKLTHLIYAFANVTPTGCAIADSWADYQSPYLPSVNGSPYTGPLYGNFAAMLQLKALHPNLKIVISLGGASATNTSAFSKAASTQSGRQALASSCIDMFIKGNVAAGVTAPDLFDGINIDWEFPTASDTQNFTLLLQEFRSQLGALTAATGKQYDLSFDGPAGSQNYTNIDLAQAAAQVDYITIDGYDYAGSWDTVTNHGSPLLDSRNNPNFGQGLSINATVDAYLSAGVPASKYLMGLPLYGAGWTGVPEKDKGLYQASTGPSPVLNANGIGLCASISKPSAGCDTLLTPGLATYSTLATLNGNGYSHYFDTQRLAAWLYNPTTGTFYTYDDQGTAFLKMLYIDRRQLGGAFVWALKDDDAYGTIVKTMAIGLGRP
ncbi:MAG: glycoside hydrolase family 18 protein [Acidobacteriota bacterium]|nr:glycoside hydrolase family 18 protein [Acidobacteriota bacterium]